jgi:hypothetical protein
MAAKKNILSKLSNAEFKNLSPTELVNYFHDNRMENESIKNFIERKTEVSYDRFTKKILTVYRFDKNTKFYVSRDGKQEEKIIEKNTISSDTKIIIDESNMLSSKKDDVFEEPKDKKEPTNKENSLKKRREIIANNFDILKEQRKTTSVYLSKKLANICDAIQENQDPNYHFHDLSRSDIVNIAINELFEKYGF